MKRNRKLIRIIALVLVVLLVGGVVVGALVSAFAETPGEATARNRFEMDMEYMETEQALHIEQRLVYINRTGEALDRVVFYAAPNMLRRQSALMYEAQDLAAVFPAGYAPGGIDLRQVRVNGEAADYGFQGEDELYLRVGCDIPSGQSATFEFDYFLLLTQCNAFIGIGKTDVRLSAFYFMPGIYDAGYHEFMLNRPLPFARWLYADSADYEISLALPYGYDVAATGEAEIASKGAEGQTYHISAQDVRELAFAFGRRWRRLERTSKSGTTVRVFSGSRNAASAVKAAVEAVEQCEEWFGAFPQAALTVAESDYPLDALNYPGLILLPSECFDRSKAEACAAKLRFCVAQQYFGLSAYVQPSADAWLTDSVSGYISYLIMEQREGRAAFLKAINRDWVSALQLTVPGGLTVTSSAELFDSSDYDIVVRRRGAVVLHELREAMGLESLLRGLRGFYALGQSGAVLTEMDFVSCMDAASGRAWEDFLTDWVFNVGEYVNQPMDWFE